MQFSAKVAIFDMDGTLIDSMHCWRLIYRDFLREHHLPEPEIILHESAEKLYTRKSAQIIAEQYGTQLGMTWEDIFEEYKSLIVKRYATDVLPREGALEYLDWLHAHGVRVGLCTATSEKMAVVVLDRLGFTEKLDFAYFGENVSKSNPDYFLRVTKEQGTTPQDCVMFEDALYAMKGAKEAGLTVYAIEDRFAALDREEIKQIADRYFYRYQELMNE